MRGRHPLTALNIMAKMPNFDAAHQQFLFERIRKEADGGCKLLSEPPASDLTREEVENYSTEQHYETLVSAFPELMTTLSAVVSKDSYDDGAAVQVALNSVHNSHAHLLGSQLDIFSCLLEPPSMVRVEPELTTGGLALPLRVDFSTIDILSRSGS